MTINRLNQGTTNQVLVKAISGQTTNLLELQDSSGNVVSSIGPTGALTGIGKILQVVEGSYDNVVNSTSSSFVDTGLTQSITLSKDTNKVLILISQNYGLECNASSAINGEHRLLRDATTIETINIYHYGAAAGSTGQIRAVYPMNVLDSPGTTSSITYKIQMRTTSTGNSRTVQGVKGRITLMEVEA
jgi:hypothetical protein